MRKSGRVAGWVGAAVVAAAGCHAPNPRPTSPPDPLPAAQPPPPPVELPVVEPSSLEPDLASLPWGDPLGKVPPAAAPGTVFRGLTEPQCRELAVAHAPLAEAVAPAPADCPADESLLRELRVHAVDAARNKAAADALDQFFRLADAEARGRLLRDLVPVLDDLRADVRKSRDLGVRVAVEPGDVDRQRAALIGLIGQADLAVGVLNVELKRRVGADGRGSDRLWPVGPFPVSAAPVDVEAAVSTALERRGDLRFLRTAYLRLTPETVEAARAAFRDRLLEHLPDPLAGFPRLKRIADRRKPPLPSPTLDAAGRAELAVVRQRLFDLTASRERQAADEVRAAAAALDAATRQVAVARWTAEGLAAKADEAKARGPLAELPARAEAMRARADVAAAVYGWHAARVKLLAAQGVLPD